MKYGHLMIKVLPCKLFGNPYKCKPWTRLKYSDLIGPKQGHPRCGAGEAAASSTLFYGGRRQEVPLILNLFTDDHYICWFRYFILRKDIFNFTSNSISPILWRGISDVADKLVQETFSGGNILHIFLLEENLKNKIYLCGGRCVLSSTKQ